jgi:hypothetical protein
VEEKGGGGGGDFLTSRRTVLVTRTHLVVKLSLTYSHEDADLANERCTNKFICEEWFFVLTVNAVSWPT